MPRDASFSEREFKLFQSSKEKNLEKTPPALNKKDKHKYCLKSLSEADNVLYNYNGHDVVLQFVFT